MNDGEILHSGEKPCISCQHFDPDFWTCNGPHLSGKKNIVTGKIEYGIQSNPYYQRELGGWFERILWGHRLCGNKASYFKAKETP